MLKTLVGDEGYRKATDLYFARHDGQAATVEDWVKCFEDASGRDLKQFRLWYRQAGHARRSKPDGAYDAQGAHLHARPDPESCAPRPASPDKKPMHIPVRVGLVGQSRARICR